MPLSIWKCKILSDKHHEASWILLWKILGLSYERIRRLDGIVLPLEEDTYQCMERKDKLLSRNGFNQPITIIRLFPLLLSNVSNMRFVSRWKNYYAFWFLSLWWRCNWPVWILWTTDLQLTLLLRDIHI